MQGGLDSFPVSFDPTSSVALISPLQHKDVLMYLVAVKSSAAQIAPRAVLCSRMGPSTRAIAPSWVDISQVS